MRALSHAVAALAYYTPEHNPGLYHEADNWLGLVMSELASRAQGRQPRGGRFNRMRDATDSDPEARQATEHLQAVGRVYGPETWEVYDLLDRSLDPRGPEKLLALAAEHLSDSALVLDVGCRDASHLIELIRATGARGAGVEPVPRLLERARVSVAEAGLQERVQLVEAVIQSLPWPDGSFDLVWCRDVIEIVEDLAAGMAEIARVLRPGGRALIFTVFATDRLEPRERALLFEQNLALVQENLAEENVEAVFGRAGLEVILKDVIGTEWREHAEERTQPVTRDLLRLARLRRQRDRIVRDAGEAIYGHIESNLHWSVYQFLGKLKPTIYLLQKPSSTDQGGRRPGSRSPRAD